MKKRELLLDILSAPKWSGPSYIIGEFVGENKHNNNRFNGLSLCKSH
jgi:hypothetical protein